MAARKAKEDGGDANLVRKSLMVDAAKLEQASRRWERRATPRRCGWRWIICSAISRAVLTARKNKKT